MQRFIYLALAIGFTRCLTVSAQSPPNCPFPSDFVTYYPVTGNCAQYWECYRGSRYLRTCPTGTLWSVWFQRCDYENNVDCSENNVTTEPTLSPTIPTLPVWTPDPSCPFPSHEITFLPHPDCTKYYECYEGYKFVMNCPNGLHWNRELNTCDYPANANCVG